MLKLYKLFSITLTTLELQRFRVDNFLFLVKFEAIFDRFPYFETELL
jgi:hypothetical protein